MCGFSANIKYGTFSLYERTSPIPRCRGDDSVSPRPAQVSYRRLKHREVSSLTTTNSTAELTLPADDDYIVHIRALSEGGLGPATDAIQIHKLSKLGALC